jgi:hypothetical protein
MAGQIRFNAERGTFEALDERGNVIPPEALAAPLRAKLYGGNVAAPSGAGELVFGAIAGEIPLSSAARTRSAIVHHPVAAHAALTADERKICMAMGVSEADFLATRAAQPSKWASPPVGPGSGR